MSGFDAAAADATTVEALRAVGGLKWSLHPDRIGAFVAESDFGTAPAVTAALRECVDAGRLGYLPPGLQQRMAEATARFVGDRHGWSLDPRRVRPLGDVLAGLVAVMAHFLPAGARVVVPTPAYMPFLTVPGACGREVVEVALTRDDARWVYDLDALTAALRPGDLLLLCNPHNPVGRVLTAGELHAIAEVVEACGARVFSDEIHAPLVLPGHRHVPYAALTPETAAHTITATSASKAWNLAGLKCAQLLLSNDADAARWAEVGLEHEHGASTPGVAAAVAAYDAGRDWLDGQLAYLDGSRRLLGDLLAEHLPAVGHTALEGTYLTLLDLRPLGLGDEPAAVLAERAGVVLTEGRLCGRAATGWARLNLATPRPILADIVRRIAAAV